MSVAPIEQERLFGQMLVDLRLASPEQIAQAVARQRALQGGGERRRLGVILVENGVISPEEVRQVLEFQGKALMSCRACDKSFNILGWENEASPACPVCGAPLSGVRLAEELEADLRAAGTQVMPRVEPPAPPPPAAEEAPSHGLAETPAHPPTREMAEPAAGSAAGTGARTAGTAAVPRARPASQGSGSGTLPLPARTPPYSGRPFGRYRLLETIGSGGMGVVWKAWDTELRRVVALKHIKEDKAGLKADRLRFLREAHLAAKLRHPGIVAVHDVGEAEGRPYITMDFIAGRTMSACLEETRPHKRKGERIAPERLRQEVALLADVAEAVAYAHEHGVIHRDLKPSNVLLDANGHPFVMDFGLGKEVAAEPDEPADDPDSRRVFMQTASGEVLGTPAYMSPEQATGDAARIGPCSDVWAMGVSLYEVLAGETPFERAGRRHWDVLRSVVEEEPARPRARNPHVPDELEAVTLKALEKDSGRRYGSMRDLEADLRRWLRGEPVEARHPTLTYRMWRTAGRHKRWVAVAAALLAVASLALYFRGRERAQAEHARLLAAEVIGQMRETARVCVGEALAARRGGRLDAGRRLTERLREAYERAQATLSVPSPEPAYLMGRMLRANLDDTGAAAYQERALAIAPHYAPAVYEQAVLCARAYQVRLADARREALARLGADLAGSGKLASPADAAVRPPSTEELEAGDARLAALHAGTVDRLERLRGLLAEHPEWGAESEPLLRVDAAKLACAKGMLAAYSSGTWEECAAALGAALEGDRTLEEAYEALSHAAARAGRWEDAIEACRRGLEVDGGYVPHWLDRGTAHLEWAVRRAGRGEEASENYAAAIADFGKAAELLPERPEGWEGRAGARMKWGLYRKDRGGEPNALFAEAIADLGKALAVAPSSVRAWSRRGSVQVNWGKWRRQRGEDPRPQYEAGLADFDRALALDETDAQSWKNRAAVRMNLATYARARKEDPAAPYAAAIADLDRALALDPADGQAWTYRGMARLNLGGWRMECGEDPSAEYAAATADFAQAETLRPEDALVPRTRGTLRCNWAAWRMERGEDPSPTYAAAQADYDRALELNPQDAESWRQRGLVRRQLAVWRMDHAQDPSPLLQAALQDLDQALARDASNAAAWRDRGMVHQILALVHRERKEDPTAALDAAIANYEGALQRNPRIAEVPEWLAEVKAAREAARPATTPPRWRTILKEAEAETRAGRWPRARELYGEALRPDVQRPPGTDPSGAPGEADRPALAEASYNLACLLAQGTTGRDAPAGAPRAVPADEAARMRDEAFARLNAAFDLGWNDAAYLEKDTDLEPLRADPRWEAARRRLGK